MYLHFNNVYWYKRLYLVYIYTSSLVLDIRLKNLEFKFLATSGTQSFASGSWILLQLPLHLLDLILKRKSTGSSLLTLTIFRLPLHYWLFIKTHFNRFKFDKLQPKNIITETNIRFTNPNIFILFHSVLSNTSECLIYQQLQ